MNTHSSVLSGAVRAVACLVVATLAGCAAAPAERSSEFLPDMPSQMARREGSVRLDTDDARIAQLWSAAQQSYSEGDEVQALEHLYEGLAIAPDNGIFWSRAAEIQLDADQAVLAENLAIRSNAVAGDNRALQYRNWLIIEHSRNMRGDLLGVRSAHRQVQQYQYQ